MDMTKSIEPKSDQLNSEDLLAGPRTFTIAEVKKGSDEQPVDVHLVEFPGRPFKPSKTVRRLMVAAWGVDSATYAGQRMTLYRDPLVKFGGMDVGGIRVSHMSGIPKAVKVALTVSRGKRAVYVVQPLADAKPVEHIGNAPEAITDAQVKKIHVLVNAVGMGGNENRDRKLRAYAVITGRDIGSTKELTKAEASDIIRSLEQRERAEPEPDWDSTDATGSLPIDTTEPTS